MAKAGLLNILRGGNTVFTFKDILLASGETNPSLLRRRINYYVKNREIYPIRRGIYAKDKNYDRLELANKIFYEKAPNIKVEINRRNFGSRYELKSYLSVSMLVMVKEDMFSHKQVAMLERTKTANRDIFDVRHFLKNRWPINKEMVEKRTKMDFKDYLNENILENPRKIVAEGRNGIARIKNIGKKSIREIALVLYELGYVEWLKPYRGDRKFLGLRAR